MKHLLVEYLPRVYRFALRLVRQHHEAEEIVQEAYLRAWRRRDDLHDPAAVRAWLFRIVVNVWRDRVRASSRGLVETATVDPDVAVAAQGPDLLEGQDEVRRVLRLMDGLPDRQRQVLYLSAIEEMGHAEIARVLEISPEAVKANLSLARKTMRRWIG